MRTAAIGVLLAAVLPALAGEAGAERPRVYTNADLEQFGPPSGGSTVTGASQDLGWGFVTDFLDREHARIDADRAADLERRRVDIEQNVAERPRSGMSLAYGYGYYGYGYYDGYGHDGRGRGERGHGPREKPFGANALSRRGLWAPIVPLHARPSDSQIQRGRAMRHSGADAVPKRP